MKCYAFYFDAEKATSLLKKKIKDGTIKTKNKMWNVDKTEPYLFETKNFIGQKKIYPLYIISHNNALPHQFDFEDSKLKQGTVTPTNYSKLMEQGAIRELLNVRGIGSKDMFMWMIIGGVMGVLGGFIIGGFA